MQVRGLQHVNPKSGYVNFGFLANFLPGLFPPTSSWHRWQQALLKEAKLPENLRIHIQMFFESAAAWMVTLFAWSFEAPTRKRSRSGEAMFSSSS